MLDELRVATDWAHPMLDNLIYVCSFQVLLTMKIIFGNLRGVKKGDLFKHVVRDKLMFHSDFTVFSQEALQWMAEIPQYLDAKHRIK